MGYNGQVAIIPLGGGGLHTDDPHTIVPPTDLISARNVSLKQGVIEKEPGSRRYNQTAFDAGVRAVFDWWPDEVTQRQIVVTADGKVWRMRSAYSQVEVTGDTATLTPGNQPHIMTCGNESAGRSRKLFILTGQNPVQVITGDGTTRTDISGPAADWSGVNQPSFALQHKNRIVAFGNKNDPHRIYISDDDDHESFDEGGAQYSVYPGEGERLFSGFSYKGRLFLLKYPGSVYFVDDANPNVAEWRIIKVSESFGGASAHAAAEVLDDILLANSTGSVTSVAAAQEFGDVKSGDILSNLRCESYMRATTSPSSNLDRWALYYSDKKQAYFTYRSGGGLRNDRILVVDVASGKPKITWSEKDQPNCLALMKDVYGVQRPIYGSEDGYIYIMDQEDRDVAGSAYRAEFQTPHMDFSWVDPVRAESNKIFQFLEVVFEPTGRWPVYVEVYIDGVYSETVSYTVSHGPVLGAFTLGTHRLTDRVPRAIMKPLHGHGRRISFKVYNAGLRENFKLTALRVYYKYAGQQQKAATA